MTIPAEICQAAGLHLKDTVYVYLVGGVVCIKRFDEGGFRPEVIPVRVTPQVDVELEG